MNEALYYEKVPGGKVRCHLCPQECNIPEGKTGLCVGRKNEGGTLYSLVYGRVTSMALDPVEKKPLYHFHAGEFILSIGTFGCNFKCPWCQNWSISQNNDAGSREYTPDGIVKEAIAEGSFGIAYTYSEPFTWYEFVRDTSRLAGEKGLKNVLVTNGYVSEDPLRGLLPFVDAMNIDIKSMDESFYRKHCKATLEPVLNTARIAARSCHVEITNLVIPTLNDTEDHFRRLAEWIRDNMGQDTPLHFSRYFPTYRCSLPATPVETLSLAKSVASSRLKRVYLGNI